jgi:hypothetical protein
MNDKFKDLISQLHTKFEILMAMPPVTVDTVPKDTPTGGVYLFSVGNDHLYVGRTKRSIRHRLKDHVSTADDCPFAWRLARETTKQLKASYRREGSRADLLSRHEFKCAYDDAKARIRCMDVRYVGEGNPLRQALLEIYVAVATDAKHNDFDTH